MSFGIYGMTGNILFEHNVLPASDIVETRMIVQWHVTGFKVKAHLKYAFVFVCVYLCAVCVFLFAIYMSCFLFFSIY